MTASEDRCLAIRTFFSLLDYSCHKDDLELWERFKSLLLQVRGSDDSNFIDNEWADRESWWVAYHFTNRTADKQVSEVDSVKQSVLKLIRG